MRVGQHGRLAILSVLCLWSGPSWSENPNQAPTPPPPQANPAKSEGTKRAPEASAHAWKLDEVMEHLGRHPHDPYLQYVALQLARRNNELNVIAHRVRRRPADPGERLGRGDTGNPRIELFSFLTGRFTIHENLQLELCAGQPPIDPELARRNVNVPPGLDGLAEQLVDRQKLSFPAQVGGVGAWPASGQWLAMNLAMSGPEVVVDFMQKAFVDKMVRDQQEALTRRRGERVPLLELGGPNLKSPFWHGMLGRKQPAIGLLARSVPEDFYLVEFRSLTKMLEAADQLNGFSRYVANQAFLDARAENTFERIQAQLGLPGQTGMAGLLDKTVGEVGIAGSDLFLDEGSDVTLLCRLKEPQAFRLGVGLALQAAVKEHAQAKTTTGKILDVAYTHVGTPDRSLWVYVADPLPDLHLRTNSLVALERVLAAIQGKTSRGQPAPRLGDASDYKYFRALLPGGAAEEDGFLFISDACLRRFVGPEVKLTAFRRQIGHTHLRMLGYAVQMYKTEHGKPPASLADLAKAGCCPGAFNEGDLRCPCGGKYSLAPDGTPLSSVFGSANHLRPCCEIPLTHITGEEAELYKQFADDIKNNWAELFAPIAVRLQTGPRLRLEWLMPWKLDEEVAYKLNKYLGKAPALDDLPVPKRNLFTFAAGLDRAPLVKDLDQRFGRAMALKKLSDFLDPGQDPNNPRVVVGFRPRGNGLQPPPFGNPFNEEDPFIPSVKQLAMLVAGCTHPGLPTQLPWPAILQEKLLEDTDEIADFFRNLESSEGAKQLKLRQLLTDGLEWQVGVHTYDTPLMFDINWAELFAWYAGQNYLNADRTGMMIFQAATQGIILLPSIVTPLYVSVPVRDAKVVDEFLNRLDVWLPKEMQHLMERTTDASVKGVYYQLTTKGKVSARAIGFHAGPIRFRMFLARIGNGLYLANQPSVLDDIKAAADLGVQGRPATSPRAHAMIRLRPGAWDQARPGFNLGWAEVHREACLANLGGLDGSARAFAAAPPKSLSWDDRAKAVHAGANSIQGTKFYCPDGGRYVLSKDGKAMACTHHGSAQAPRQHDTFALTSDLGRLLHNLTDVQATITFQPEGARVVLLIDRK